TGLSVLSADVLLDDAAGTGLGGEHIARMVIRDVLYIASPFPLILALLLALVFRGYTEPHGRATWSGADVRVEQARTGPSVGRVLLGTAAIMVVFQLGFAGDTALLPLLGAALRVLAGPTAGRGPPPAG